MEPTRRWVTASAASVLGLGVIASSAVGLASAITLVDTSEVVGIAPITAGSSGDSAPPTAVPSESPDPVAPGESVTDPSPGPPAEAPAPAPAPVAPEPASSVSVVTPASPTEVDDDSDDE